MLVPWTDFTAHLVTPSPELLRRLAPTGTLRASINLGNPLLAGTDPTTGAARGVSVDLAEAFARQLGLPLALTVFQTAADSVDAVAREQADIGFFAIDPKRGAAITFTASYLLIEGAYLVPESSPIVRNEDVDRPGHRVAVGAGSAYDLFLTRELKAATIVRAPSSPAVIDTFMAQGLEVAAGVKQQLQADARRLPGHRLLDGHFMIIRQAMGLPRSRGDKAAAVLAAFVEAAKAGGFVEEALRRHGIEGASVAPAA